MTVLGAAERVLLVAGVVLTGFYLAATLHRTISSRSAIRQFDEGIAAAHNSPQLPVLPLSEVDFSLWSPRRIATYRESLVAHTAAPVGVLRLARFDLRIPIFAGTDPLNLNRGVGWIASTAKPGELGNVGIAGHRDGFFRQLKDCSPGDSIELSAITATSTYVVDQIEIVNPENIGVLGPRKRPSITLVTCYPFYFTGNAPLRFIVHAYLKERIQHD